MLLFILLAEIKVLSVLLLMAFRIKQKIIISPYLFIPLMERVFVHNIQESLTTITRGLGDGVIVGCGGWCGGGGGVSRCERGERARRRGT